jgi:signal peptidase I
MVLIGSFLLMIASLVFLVEGWIINWGAARIGLHSARPVGMKVAFLLGTLSLLIEVLGSIYGSRVYIPIALRHGLELLLLAIFACIVIKRYYGPGSATRGVVIYFLATLLGGLVGVGLVVFIRSSIAAPYLINVSISPSVKAGDYVLVNLLDRDFRRNDIVVFQTQSESDFHVGKVLAVGGQHVQLSAGTFYLDGVPIRSSDLFTNINPKATLNLYIGFDQLFLIIGPSADGPFDTFATVSQNLIVGSYWTTLPPITGQLSL